MSEAATAGAYTAIRPFRIDVGQQELDHLRGRIAATRGPSGSWSQIGRRADDALEVLEQLVSAREE